MLYFLKQTFNMYESHIHSFLTHFLFICYNVTNFWPLQISRANSFITLPPLTLTSFKARKNGSVNGMPENVASMRILTKWQPQYFIEYNAISFFAGIYHQHMDIYHTKKRTENIPRSWSYLLLKTLFYIISQCTSVPYLESGLCKLDKELDKNFNFTFI